jgi:hypothetical protein
MASFFCIIPFYLGWWSLPADISRGFETTRQIRLIPSPIKHPINGPNYVGKFPTKPWFLRGCLMLGGKGLVVSSGLLLQHQYSTRWNMAATAISNLAKKRLPAVRAEFHRAGTGGTTVAPAWIQHLKPWRSLGRGIRRPKSKVWGPTWISPAPRLTVIHIQSSSRLHCGHDQCPYMFPYIISLICSAMWVLFLGASGGALVCFVLFEDVKVGCHVPYGWTQAPISPDCMSNWDVSSFWSLTCIPVRKWL